MTKASQKVLELTHAARTDYFSEDSKLFFALQMKVNAELAGMEAPKSELLVLNAPEDIDIRERVDLPATVVRFAGGLRNWDVSHAINAHVLVQDLDGGVLKSKRLVVPGEERAEPPTPSATGPKPTGFGASSTSTSLQRYFLRQQLNVEWRPSRLAISLIDYDARSNTVVVKLSSGPVDSRNLPLVVVPPSHFVKSSQAAETADAEPIKLSIDRSGSPHAMTVAGVIHAPLASLSAAASRSGVTRPDIVLATLLFARLDHPPLAIDLALPAKLTGEVGKEELWASFSFDAALQLPKDMPAGLYQVHLVAGLIGFGPLPLSIDSNSSGSGR